MRVRKRDRERVSESEREIERESERHKDLEMRRSGRHMRARECTHTRNNSVSPQASHNAASSSPRKTKHMLS